MNFLRLSPLLLFSLLTSVSPAQMSGTDLQAVIDATPAGGTVYLPEQVNAFQTININKTLVLTPAHGTTRIYGSAVVKPALLTSSDPNYSRFDPSVVPNIYVVDLVANGVDPGQIVFPSTENSVGSPNGLYELEEDDSQLAVTRYPATGFLQCVNTYTNMHFQAAAPFPSNWSDANETGLNHYIAMGYFCAGESFEESMPANLNPAGGNVEMLCTDNTRAYQNLQNLSRYAIENILEELKKPGQYYVDYNLKHAYFIPTCSTFQTIRVSVCGGPILQLGPSASGTQFSGDIQVLDGRADGIDCAPGLQRLGIHGLTVENVFGTGISFQNLSNSMMSGLTVAHTGGAGIYLTGGDTASLTSSGVEMFNFTIDDTCKIFRTNCGALYVSGVGQFIHHGSITNSPNQAIMFNGNNIQFLNITIDGAAQEAGDVGAIYCGRSMVQWGDSFNNITINNIPPQLITTKPGGSGIRYGIYLDDQFSGLSMMNITGNNTNCLIYLGGGVFNTVQNVYANNCTESPVQMDDRGENYQSWAWSGWFSPEYLWALDQSSASYNAYGGLFLGLGLVELLETGAPQFCTIHNVNISNSPGVKQNQYSSLFKNPNGFITLVDQN